MVDRLVLRNTEHRKLSADNGARPGEDVKVLLPDHLFSIGYPGAYKKGEEPEWAYFPNLHDTDDDSQGAIELECDDFASPGWSGGPLYGPINNDWKVVGVCSDEQAEYVFPFGREHDSVFAGGSWMGGLIKYGFANWPS